MMFSNNLRVEEMSDKKAISGSGLKRCDWQRLIEAYKLSGMAPRAYCETKGLNIKHFYNWQSILRRASDKNRFAEVKLRAMPKSTLTGLTLVMPNGIRLEVGANGDVQLLQQVLAMLVELPC